MKDRKTIDFLGIQVDVLDTDGLLDSVLEFASHGRQFKIMYVNTDCMLLSLKDKSYQQTLNRADLVYADGVGVVWGARLWGHHLPGRSTAADFMPGFCEKFARNGLSVYLLGAREGVADKAAACLRQNIPDLKIAGTHHGYFNKEETLKVINNINAAKPDILIVGLGAPYQEKWIEENAKDLPAAVIWGVGGLFDFISGKTWRGPQWLLDNGFEWLCRLIVEPRRLWYRYLIGNSKFLMYLLWHRFIANKAL